MIAFFQGYRCLFSVSLRRGAVSFVCDCGISLSYPLAIDLLPHAVTVVRTKSDSNVIFCL